MLYTCLSDSSDAIDVPRVDVLLEDGGRTIWTKVSFASRPSSHPSMAEAHHLYRLLITPTFPRLDPRTRASSDRFKTRGLSLVLLSVPLRLLALPRTVVAPARTPRLSDVCEADCNLSSHALLSVVSQDLDHPSISYSLTRPLTHFSLAISSPLFPRSSSIPLRVEPVRPSHLIILKAAPCIC